MIYQDVIFVYKGDQKKKVHEVDKQGWLEDGWKTQKDSPKEENQKPLRLDASPPVGPTETRKRVTKETE